MTEALATWTRFVNAWRTRGIVSIVSARFADCWRRFWMRRAGRDRVGRLATRLAALATPPYKGRVFLADLSPAGFVSPSASMHCADVRLGANVFIGDGTIVYQADADAGRFELGDRVRLHREIIVEIGAGGSMSVGRDTHIQPRCQFSAYKGPIRIGCDVQIAPRCAFYSYDHGFEPGELMRKQPLRSKGGIVIEDDVWLGVGVIVLDGVHIGRGAVVGAGSVVTQSIPAGAIAVGVPARVVDWRGSEGGNAE